MENLNIHPIFVHFPVAFLFVYSIIKILPVSSWFPTINWGHINKFLIFFGLGGAALALFTGELAEEVIGIETELIETHSFFAWSTTWIFTVLFISEFIELAGNYLFSKNPTSKFFSAIVSLGRLLNSVYLSKLLAILGFLSIGITGALGGVITYGTEMDPFSPILIKLLGIDL